MKTQEYRSGNLTHTTGRIIEGYAFKFNTESNLIEGKFIEIIKPGAVTQQELDSYDVVATFNHIDTLGVLARSRKGGKNTLELKVDNVGLFFRFTAPNTQLGNDVLEMIKNGDITNTSFAFTVEPTGNVWTTKDGVSFREITKFSSIVDISLVVRPAYIQDAPTVSARNANAENELKQYYAKFDKIINDLKNK
jgi:HK97 family phage prohead protease